MMNLWALPLSFLGLVLAMGFVAWIAFPNTEPPRLAHKHHGAPIVDGCEIIYPPPAGLPSTGLWCGEKAKR